ncbi:3-deoxy-D-manno-octulosonic acid transferase [Desulforhopalus sp. 52FAK]
MYAPAQQGSLLTLNIYCLLLINIFLNIYGLVWRVALPILKRARRTSFGWQERVVETSPSGPFDIWIQAASGGESMLTNMIIDELTKIPHSKNKLKILATSGTKEGVDSLNKGKTALKSEQVDIQTAYFPLDAPFLMEKAFDRFSPSLVVILETELWPAFLITAKKNNVPVFLVNGRMSDKSAGTYKRFSRFFSSYGPEKIWAISELDQGRFKNVMGTSAVDLMNNIKFDRITPVHNHPKNPKLLALLPEGKPFVLLGSIRREEEDKVVTTIKQLLIAHPDITIGVFPKHITRAELWRDLLKKENIVCSIRSEISADNPASSVIIWDVFGELADAYNLAQTAFVGGSLVNLGGQNFLEPLVFGLRPIIGPYWRNFGWVGRNIVTSGLVTEVDSETSLTKALLKRLEQQPDKEVTLDLVQNYFEPKKGGTQFVCQKITQKLHAIDNL